MHHPTPPLRRIHARRQILVGCTSLLAASVVRSLPAAAALPRTLNFQNLHTGERLRAAYWFAGAYVDEELKRIAWVLRDHRTDATHPIDPALLDLLSALGGRLETSQPFQIISGYRSPQTNAALARASEGVATQSLHMLGKAIDIRVPGAALAHVRDAALGLHNGGVGFYPRSDFVHVDVGRVRRW